MNASVISSTQEYGGGGSVGDTEIGNRSQSNSCTVINTVRVYGPEANNIFGPGFFSLQVQVSQAVKISSTFLLWSEAVQNILEAGFDVVSGGQQQFRSNLRNSSPLFLTVVAVEVRGGLSPPADPPTIPPSPYPSPNPSDSPTMIPSASPTSLPSIVPSFLPSFLPTPELSMMPSIRPSFQPTTVPVLEPDTLSPTSLFFNPTILSSFDNEISDKKELETDGLPAWTIALIVLAAMTTVFGLLYCSKRKKKNTRKDDNIDKNKRGENLINDVIRKFVPPKMVELNDDQQSLAETSLGSRTAGGWGFRKSISPPSNRYKIQHATPQPLGYYDGNSKITMRQFGTAKSLVSSFDENSLYTTPFAAGVVSAGDESVESDLESATISPLPTPSSISSNQHSPIDIDSETSSAIESMSVDLSPVKGHHGASPMSKRSAADRRSMSPSKRTLRRQLSPFDLDSNELYQDDMMIITKIEPVLPTVEEHNDDFELEPEEMDVWSFDYGNMNSFPESIRNGNNSDPRSLSSTTSTAPINNTKTNSEAGSKDVIPSSIQTSRNKGNASKDTKAGETSQPEPKTKPEEVIHEKTTEPPQQKLPTSPPTKIVLRDILANRQSYSQSSSKSSHGSKKSFSSMKTHTGTQDPPVLPSRPSPTSYRLSTSIDSVINPLTRLFESFSSVPSTTLEEEDESEDSSHKEEDVDTEENEEEKSRTDLYEKTGDDRVDDGDSDDELSASPWLMEKLEETLGPKSKSADMESLSGVSNRSQKRGTGSRKNGSEVSFGSRISSQVGSSVLSVAASSSLATDVMAHGNEIAIPTTKSAMMNDLKRLERQLASLEERDVNTTTSSITMTTITGASLSTISSLKNSKVVRRRRVVVIAPPGKLGVHLVDRHDGQGTVISEVRDTSPLEGALSPGDKLVAVDEIRVDGSTWTCAQITSLIAKRSGSERRLTILTK